MICKNIFAVLSTFDPLDSRNKKRYHVDPTTNERQDGLIVAQEISYEEAYSKFSKRLLLDFSI